MDYKKKYKEALERARVYHTGGSICDAHMTEVIFPELKESGEERMKKAIIHVLYENYTDAAVIEGVEIAEIFTWLEKQGKTADKIEPNPAWSEEDEEMLTWLCRIIHSQRLDRAITLKEESELGKWIDKWLNYNPQTKQCEHLENYDEEERIRKVLLNDFKNNCSEYYCEGVNRDMIIAWLEKQGKKKSVDEVLKIRQELYQSGYNDGYKHGQEDIAISLEKESIDALEHFVRSIGESGYASPYDNRTKLVYTLLERLKQIVK